MTYLPQISKTVLLETAKEMKNCFTLVSLEQEDQPLVFVNEIFLRLTGYSEPEITGKNCRFLQGELSSKNSIENIRMSLKEKIAIFQDLINYKKNGDIFWNRLILLPVILKNEGLHYIGVQHDVSNKKNKQGFNFNAPNKQKISDLEIKDRVFNPLNALFLHKQFMEYESNPNARVALGNKINDVLARLSTNSMIKLVEMYSSSSEFLGKAPFLFFTTNPFGYFSSISLKKFCH
ncbi:MAG: PAS domain-containing protein [Oligoflexales bacterium]